MFFGYRPAEGGATRIGRVYKSGETVLADLNWAILQSESITETCPVHGGLYVDQTGLFNYDLLVVTGGGVGEGGRVWRTGSDANQHSQNIRVFVGIPTAQEPAAHLEGVVTLPDDETKYGPWAGRILTGDESHSDQTGDPIIYAIDRNGAYQEFHLDVEPEDVDVIAAAHNLFCNEAVHGWIYKVPSWYFADCVGDVLVTQAGEWYKPPRLVILHWDEEEQRFVQKVVVPPSEVSSFEHVTFAPIDL